METIFYKYNKILILVDPISFGISYLDYAKKMGFGIVKLYTLNKEILTNNNIQFSQNAVDGEISIYDSDLKLVIAKLVSIKNKIVGVIPCTEPGVESACYLADALTLPGNNPNTIKLARNKYLMRECLNEAKLATPNYAICKNLADIDSFLQNNSFPVVIKTPEGAGSDNVFFCQTRQDLEEKMNIILNSRNLFGIHAQYALIESFIQGQEYVFDLFADGNQNLYLTDIFRYEKVVTNSGGFAYKTAIMEDIDNVFFNDTYLYLKKVVKEINLERGSIHCEVIIDSSGKNPILVELGARIPGVDFAHIVSECSNFNPYIENIKVFSDPKYKWKIGNIKQLKQGAIVFTPVQKEGTLRKFVGLSNIEELCSYHKHKTFINPGNYVIPTTNLQNNIAIFWLINNTMDQLLYDINQIHTLFDIDVF